MRTSTDAIDHQTVLFFRVYREISLPLYGAMIDRMCASSSLPFEFATVLEDIGQFFIRLSGDINSELLRRGVLGEERDAVETVEARSNIMIETVMDALADRGTPIDDPIGVPIDADALRQTLKVAVAMAHDLPLARSVMESLEPSRGMTRA